jgi:hypothetical protein
MSGNPTPVAHADDERWGPWRCKCGHKSTDHHYGDDDKGNFGDYCEQCDCRWLQRLAEYTRFGPSV